MGIMVYSSLWVQQDLYHQPYWCCCILTTKTSPQVGSPLCDFGVELAALVRDCDPRLELMGARVGFFIKVKVPM